ncbi:DUF2079 domain-containing protein [Streptomyces sp. NPDC059985]|uniref:DUF2079 domain-containing protein n=1 Tax=Streptomyces sp. NPDC059985 TaxID=3347025 RepID=UPI0036C5E86A
MTMTTGQIIEPSAVSAHEESDGVIAWWGWAVALFVLYTSFSLMRHHNLATTGYDLGIFTQAVRGYAEFGAPRSDLKGWNYNLFGDHFHPILGTLVPLYWLWPGAQVLLVAQAALLAVAAVPLSQLASRRLGRPGGHAVAVAYGLSFGVQGALAFDFHEVAFAAPLLAWSLTSLSRGRYRAAFFWALPLLMVKEELSLTVAAIGMVLVIRRQRHLGVLLIGIGLICFAVITGVLIAAVNPDGVYPYFSAAGEQGLLDRLMETPVLLVWPATKVTTLFLLCSLSGGIALRSPLALVALPTIAVRFLPDNPLYWGTGLQYNLPLMAIVFAAALDAQPMLVRSTRRLVRGLGRRAGAAFLIAAAPFSTGSTGHLQTFLLNPVKAFTSTPQARAAHALMRKIPDGVTVEATNGLSPHLAHRTRVYIWPLTRRQPEWAIINLNESWPVAPQYHQARVNELHNQGYRLFAVQENIALLQKTTKNSRLIQYAANSQK